jgi:hypothetical protein
VSPRSHAPPSKSQTRPTKRLLLHNRPRPDLCKRLARHRQRPAQCRRFQKRGAFGLPVFFSLQLLLSLPSRVFQKADP